MSDYLKPVETTISTKRENLDSKTISNSQISYTLIDRSQFTDKNGNYLSSFNLPALNSMMLSGDTLTKANPEIYQMNVDKVLIVNIGGNSFSEYIHGKSILFNIPQWNGANKEIISTFYSVESSIKLQENSILGENVSFLFSDDVNLPFSGSNTLTKNKYKNSWNPTGIYTDRPTASTWKDLGSDPNNYNSDQRPWSSVSLAVPVHQAYPKSVNSSVSNGYNYDIPIGFASLDKGFLVITHPDIVNNIPWTSGSTSYEDAGINIITGSNAGPTSGTTNIVFTGSVTSTMSYLDISVFYKTAAICLAMPKEFYVSQNPTWDYGKNSAEIINQTYNLDSIYITQVGLYNANNELIAVAKLDRPIEKTYDNLMSFNLEINV